MRILWHRMSKARTCCWSLLEFPAHGVFRDHLFYSLSRILWHRMSKARTALWLQKMQLLVLKTRLGVVVVGVVVVVVVFRSDFRQNGEPTNSASSLSFSRGAVRATGGVSLTENFCDRWSKDNGVHRLSRPGSRLCSRPKGAALARYP